MILALVSGKLCVTIREGHVVLERAQASKLISQ